MSVRSSNSVSTTSSTSPSSRSWACPPATMVAIFVGGALGTVARYLLEAHHPLAPGDFPWVTLVVNLTGSFAIGLLLPLTEHLTHRFPVVRPLLVVGFLGGWTTYSTLAVDAILLGQGTVTSPPAWPIWSRRWPAGWRSSWRATRSAEGWCRHERLLPHSRSRAARRRGRRCRRRPARAAHPPSRPAAFRPAARRHPRGQCVGFPAPRRADRALPVPRPRTPCPGRRRDRAVRRVHDVVDRELGDDPPAAHGSSHRGGRLHAGLPRRLPGRGGGRHRAHGARCSRQEAKASGGGQVHTDCGLRRPG